LPAIDALLVTAELLLKTTANTSAPSKNKLFMMISSSHREYVQMQAHGELSNACADSKASDPQQNCRVTSVTCVNFRRTDVKRRNEWRLKPSMI